MSKIIKKYQEVRAFSIQLCVPLPVEDYHLQPEDFVSPPKWHLAHTTWFFEEMILKKYHSNYQVFNKNYSFLFNSYYNSVGERVIRANRGDLSRPLVSEIYTYRDYVDTKIEELIKNISEEDQEIIDLIELGLNHEQQHQELLITDLKYALSLNPLYPVYKEDFSLVNQTNPKGKSWLKIQAGNYSIGINESDNFHYDNEETKHNVYLNEFEISEGLVTNQEYIEFIEDKGYQKFEYWLDEGWYYINNNKLTKPLYWEQRNDEWYQYTLSGLQKVKGEDVLAHVSFYEANAFAAWKGMRLPTEFEWEVAAHNLQWGDRWEWTNSAYLPYPNFKIKEGAVGEYNAKFMINQMVLRGASKATSPNHSRITYRNFFHPKYAWQLTGIRLVK